MPANGRRYLIRRSKFNGQNIQNKTLTYKINLKSIANIAGSTPAGGMDFRSYECYVLSVTYLCDG